MKAVIACMVLGASWLSAGKGAAADERQASVEWFVAVDGSDAGDGSIQHPFATLERARDAIREMKSGGALPAGGVTVQLRGGEYRIDRTFQLDGRDSGEADAPIVYKAYNGEKVTLSGGDALDASLFEPVTDPAVRARIPQEAADKVRQVDLKALGISDYGTLGNYLAVAPELFVDGNVMTLARWPNEGFTTVNQVVYAGNSSQGTGYTFTYDDGGLRPWSSANDTWALGYWGNDWFTNDLQIKSIDQATKTIETYNTSSYAMKAGQRFYFYNILEELDAPGEWYLDRADGMLYLYPPAPLASSRVQLSLFDQNMIAMNGASNIVFSGLALEVSRGNAIDMTGGDNNRIEYCEISKMGGYAVKINGGSNNGVYASSIYSMGNGGVSLNGGDVATLTPAGNYADNNDIFNYSRIKLTYTSAVELNGVGNRATHNKLHNAPHFAIQFRGNDHVIEYNEIYDVVKETADASAIYSGRSFVWRGNVIRYNYFHDIVASDLRVSTAAIYLDDYMSGVEMRGNVFYNIGKQAFKLANGRENIVENNIVIDTGSSIAFMNRGYKPGEKNYESLMSKFDQVPYQSDIWSERYPTLPDILSDEPLLPKRNVVRNNAIVNSGPITGDSRNMELGTFENNVTFGSKDDLGFEDAANGNFQLKEDSILYSRIPGFQPIPFSEIGVKAPGLPPAQSILAVRSVLYPVNGGSLTVGMGLNGNTLTSIRDDSGLLVQGTDYVVQGTSVLFPKTYLSKLELGYHSLTFSFSAGNRAFLNIRVTPPASSQLGASTLNYAQHSGDSTISVNLNGNTLASVRDETRMLVPGIDYVNNGTSVTLKSAYLSTLELGSYTLTFTFSGGDDAVLALNVAQESFTLNKTYLASSEWSKDYTASKAFDGSGSTRWSAEKGKVTDQFLTVDFGDSITFNQAVIKESSYQRVDSYVLQYSEDGVNYVDIPGTAGTSIGAEKKIDFAPVTGQYFRLWMFSTKKESGVSKEPTINEIEVYYTASDAFLSPDRAVFDKHPALQRDIDVTVRGNGNPLKAIRLGDTALTESRDYSVTDSAYGNEVRLYKTFLSALPVGESRLVFELSGGRNEGFTVEVKQTETQPPQLTVPPDLTVEAAGERTAVNIGAAAAPGAVSIVNDAPADFPLGVTLVHWTAIDAYGAAAAGVQTITIVDTTPPVISGAPAAEPNANGWYRTDVTVHFTAADSGSGLASVSPDRTISSEGIDQSVTGTAVDRAGNEATATVGGIRIDKTKPAVDIRLEPSYTTGQTMTVTYSVYDDLSGADGVSAALNGKPVKNGQTARLSSMAGDNVLTVTASDKAGNQTVQEAHFQVAVEAQVELIPPILIVKAPGVLDSVGAWIQLPRGYDAKAIDKSSVRLLVNGKSVHPEPSRWEFEERGRERLSLALVRFDRQQVIAAAGPAAGSVKVTVIGSLRDGTLFQGSGTLRIVR
ncbi:discoidin domain-containing protein [Paenibacillus doosanensis]|nr:discoidin domain-containing protein [Paenibacillus doosanensis]